MKNKVIIYLSIFTFLLFFPVVYQLFLEWHFLWILGGAVTILCILGIIVTFFASLFSFKKSLIPLYLLGYILIVFTIKYLLFFQIYYISGLFYLTECKEELTEIKNIVKAESYKTISADNSYNRQEGNENYKTAAKLLSKIDMISAGKSDETVTFINDGFISGSEGILYSELPKDSIKHDVIRFIYLEKLYDNWYCWKGR